MNMKKKTYFTPVLLDQLVYGDKSNQSLTNINGKWYIVKPLNKKSLLCRIYHAYLIIRNKAFAVQFAKDQFEG